MRITIELDGQDAAGFLERGAAHFDAGGGPAPARKSASFERCLRLAILETARQREESGGARDLSAFVLDSKLVAHEFTRRIGQNPVEILQAAVPLDALRPDYPCVFKPTGANTAKGVFILFSPERITYLNTNRPIRDLDALRAHARDLMERGVVEKDLWLSERLVADGAGIAADYKFYCFYGRTPLALQTRRLPRIERCWFDREGRIVSTGKYLQNAFRGTPPPRPLYRLASEISLKIPSPFVRVDVLCGGDGRTWIGEYTPVPGGFEAFDDATDARLGEAYTRAAVRLSCDVGAGKTFDDYRTCDKDEARIAAAINARAAAIPAAAP